MIMPFAGSTTPAGWLECNGAEVDIAAYPTLAAALGTTWNTAKNPLTGANYAAPAAGKFRVPDMRGAFLRGSTGGANNQNGVATALAEFQDQKTKKNGLAATAVASSISALSLNNTDLTHSHGLTIRQRNPGGSGNTISQPQRGWDSQGFDDAVYSTGNPGVTMNHAHSLASGTAAAQTITVANGDAETRPDAVGVRYLIKF